MNNNNNNNTHPHDNNNKYMKLCDCPTFLFRGESRGSFHFLQYPPELHYFCGTNIPMSAGHSKLQAS